MNSSENWQTRYILEQKLKNVTVEILKDQMTGEYSIGWYRQDDTEDITYDCEDNYD